MKKRTARRLYNNAAGVENHLASGDDLYAASCVRKAIDAMWQLRKENKRLKRILSNVRRHVAEAVKTSDDITALVRIADTVRETE